MNSYTKNSVTATDNHMMSVQELAKEYMNHRAQEKEVFITTPFPTIDKFTGGWKNGDIITIAGGIGSGKSIVGIQMALHAAETNKSVLFFTLEMGKNELLDRMISNKAQINSQYLDDYKTLREEEKERAKNTGEKISNLKIFIDDNSEVTVDYIRNSAVQLKKNELGLDMIVIDSLRLLTPNSVYKNPTKQEEFAEISRQLKFLARELDIPIIITTHLYSDGLFYEFDEIAQVSSVVLIIHRKANPSDEERIEEIAEFILYKNRRGPSKLFFKMRCMLEYSIFQDVKAIDKTDKPDYTTKSIIEDNILDEGWG